MEFPLRQENASLKIKEQYLSIMFPLICGFDQEQRTQYASTNEAPFGFILVAKNRIWLDIGPRSITKTLAKHWSK